MVVVQPTKKGEKMWTDNLRQFHFWCQKTLPLVYDDSLSYYEVLAKVTKHLNELTTLVNEIGDELERYEGVTDNRLDTLENWRTEVDSWRAQIDQWKTIVENWREDVDQWREDIDLWKTSINNWKVTVDNALASLDSRLDDAEDDIDALENRMDSAEGRLGIVEDDIVSLGGRMDTAEDDIDSLEGRMDTAEYDIDSLEGRMGTAEDDIDTLQSGVTSLDGRLDDAESAITGLDGRLDTAEDDIDNVQSDITNLTNRVNKLSIIIKGVVLYDSTNNKWLFDILHTEDKNYLLNNVDNANYLSTALSHYTVFTCVFGSANYNYEELVLSYNSTPLQYEQQDIYITVLVPPITDVYYKDFYNTGDTYYIDTESPNNARICRLTSYKLLDLPIPIRGTDDGKVVAYNNTDKKYELITPSGGSSHTYSATEHEVGTWIDGSTVYEATLTGTWSGDTNTNISIPQGATVIELQGFVYRTGSASSQTYYPIYSGDMWIDSDTTQIGMIRTRRSWGSSGTNRYFVTVRYVKELYRP